MDHPPDVGALPGASFHGMPPLSAPFDQLRWEYDAYIGWLEMLLEKAKEQRLSLDQMEEARGSLSRLTRTVVRNGEGFELQLPSQQLQQDLWIESDEEDQSPGVPCATGGAVPLNTAADIAAPEEVVVRGPRMKEILTAMGARPHDAWAASEVAEALGVSRSDRTERRALRVNLDHLAKRGALERVKIEGDHHVYYRPRMNWRFTP